MNSKIIMIGCTIFISTTQVNAWSLFNKNKQTDSSNASNQIVIGDQRSDAQKLEARKKELDTKVIAAVNQCRCRIGNIDNKQQYYPENQRAMYYNYISDMKINAGREQTKLRAIIRDWQLNRNTPSDLKALDVKVSEGLRAMSSFCYQPYTVIGGQINDFAKVNNYKTSINTLKANVKNIIDLDAKNCQ